MDYISDMDIVYNQADEPKVVIPRDQLDKSLAECSAPESDKNKSTELKEINFPEVVYFKELCRQRTWHRVI